MIGLAILLGVVTLLAIATTLDLLENSGVYDDDSIDSDYD